MFSLDKDKNNIPICIIRGETPLDGEVVYMKGDHNAEERGYEERGSEKHNSHKKNKRSKKGKVRFAD